VSNILNSDPTNYLRSDADPQLLISIPFQSAVKLNGIKFTFRDDQEGSTEPSKIRVFTNRVSLDFSDAESLPAVQEIDTPKSGEIIPLKFVLFQNIFSIQIFVQDNCGGPVTEISCIELFGQPGENMNMKEFKKVKDDE
jgi:hypothetical protein